MSESFACPNCGAEVPAKARACPECGADERTGWSEDRIYDGTGIEEPEQFDYEDWQRRERGEARPAQGWAWWLVAVGLLVLFVAWLLLAGR